MKYADWNKLTAEEKKAKHWKHHPRVRVATIFSILFAVVLFVFLLKIVQNTRTHVNRKPNDKEAYSVAKTFVQARLKQPATAVFPKSDYQATVDTALNAYDISSTVKSQDSSGKQVTSNWQVKMAYKGGDWADPNNWRLTDVALTH